MLSVLLAIAIKAAQHTAFSLLAAASLSILTLPLFQKTRRKLLFNLLFKRSTKSNKKYGRIQPWLRTLLIILGGMTLLGLLFSWTIALWVGAGILAIILIWLITGKKTPNPRYIYYEERIPGTNRYKRIRIKNPDYRPNQ
jgi:hypothetical protein